MHLLRWQLGETRCLPGGINICRQINCGPWPFGCIPASGGSIFKAILFILLFFLLCAYFFQFCFLSVFSPFPLHIHARTRLFGQTILVISQVWLLCHLIFFPLFYLWESRSNKWSVTNGVFLLKPAVWAADQGNETAAWREHQEINGPNCTGAKGNAKKVCVELEEPKACCLPQRCGGLGHF